MTTERLKSFSARTIELIIVLLLVLLFYLGLLQLMDVFFPSGATLKDLVQRNSLLATGIGAGRERDLLIYADGQEARLSDREGIAAVLANKRNTVKSKPAGSIAWRSADVGMALQDRDAIQTFTGAEALIQFDDENFLQIGENSLIIVRGLEKDPFFQEKRSFLVVVDGELDGKFIQKEGSKPVQVQVATPSGVARIRSSQVTGGEAEFKIKINADNSATVAVYKGEAEISAQGRSVRIDENQSATLEIDQAPSPVRSLPRSPQPQAPTSAEVYYYRDLPPRVEFSWSDPGDAERFRFSLARDPSFLEVLVDEELKQSRFVHGNLSGGEYYWRVAGVSGWDEGIPSGPRKIILVQDLVPPPLDVDFPPAIVTTGHYLLKGTTEAGAKVFIKGKEIMTSPEGVFEYPIQLEPGINVLVVEAFDLAGNVTYSSELVNGKF